MESPHFVQGTHEEGLAGGGEDEDQAVARTGGSSSGSARRTEIPHGLAGCNAGFRDSCPSDGWWSEQTLSLFPEGETIVMEWTPQVRKSKGVGAVVHGRCWTLQ